MIRRISGTAWYSAFNGSVFVTDLNSPDAVYKRTLISPCLISQDVNPEALGYTYADGDDFYAIYAYSTATKGTFTTLLIISQGKIIMNNITCLTIHNKSTGAYRTAIFAKLFACAQEPEKNGFNLYIP